VAAAVAQGRADWGVTIDSVARRYGLGFIPVQDEYYDFVVPKTRLERSPVRKFRAVLGEASLRVVLRDAGFRF
jgi:putative molybdopterin biosynthesis protein